jgi:DNA-binding IclR family transcriptional regulator
VDKGKSVEAVATTLSLIEYLASSPAPSRLKDISDHLDIPGSRVHRHLSTLRAHGYLEQEDATGRYYLTAKLMYLGQSVANQSDFLSASREEMPRLYQNSGLAVSVGIIEDAGVRVVDIYQQRTSVEITTWPGTLFGFDSSAQGKVAAAFIFMTEARDARKSGSAEHRLIRENGWADAPNAVLHGINAIAAPVFRSDGIAGTISMIGGIDQLPSPPSEHQIQAVREAADAISWRIGGDRRCIA